MPLEYDPTDKSEFSTPVVGVPTWVTIGEGEETTSGRGNKMLVLNVQVNKGEEGSGYKAKEYLVEGLNWKIRQILRACGLDPDQNHPIDDIFFRDRMAQVIFKADEWIGNDGASRTSYKIENWVPSESPAEAPSEPDPALAVQQPPPEEENTEPDYEAKGDIPF